MRLGLEACIFLVHGKCFRQSNKPHAVRKLDLRVKGCGFVRRLKVMMLSGGD